MALEPTTNFKDSNGVDLGRKLVTKDYLISVYPEIGQQIGIPPELWIWGNGSTGRLGNGVTTGIISTPVTTSSGGTNWKQVSNGNTHTVAIKTDGTLWVWGDNLSRQLGNASTVNVSTPVTTFLGGTNWKQVSSGNIITAAIKTDGTLWTWGAAFGGQLGNGVTTGYISTPITTFAGGTNWKQVSVGINVAAIKTDGTLWTWGYGSYGRLGNAATTDRSTPVTTFAGGTNWKQVDSGFVVAAIKTDGTLWTWGGIYGNRGQLGNASTTGRSTPVTTFLGGTNWKQVNVDLNVAAIKTDGTLWTWGNGNQGTLGNGLTTDRSTPVTTFLGGNNWKQVSNGYRIMAAIKTDGTLWTWGQNNTGQLGNASTTGRSTPVTTFAGGTNWKQVSAAEYQGSHIAAIKSVDFADF